MNPVRCFAFALLVSGCGAAARSAEPASEAASKGPAAPASEAAAPAPDAAVPAKVATPSAQPVAAQPQRADIGSCSVDADCSPYKCSTWLWLCYDEPSGYVWDAHSNDNLGGWSQPPRYFDRDGDGIRDDDCGEGHVFWPKVNRCYDPLSGYTFNETSRQWEYFGDLYTAGEDAYTEGEDAGTPPAPASRATP